MLTLPQGPSRRALVGLTLGLLLLHMALLLGLTGSLDLRLPTPDEQRVGPLQTRWLPPATTPATATAPSRAPGPSRTRLTREVAMPQPATLPEPEVPREVEAEAEPAPTPTAMPAGGLSAPTDIDAQALAGQPGADTVAMASPPLAPPAAPPAIPPAPTPELAVSATGPTTALPAVPLGALPPSTLLRYHLSGQDKGISYTASGELKWQHNDSAYALALTVKAFLVGSRQWQSVGEVGAAGLAPRRFSDLWRNERAAHFDRVNQKLVFSGNSPVVALEPGAQDQISLYVQLAAAMAADPQRFTPGTRLQVQTVTIKDAVPWLLTLEPSEILELNGQAVRTVKWVSQPRSRFDASVSFWVSAQHAWLPVRIRITQVSGSFIDLTLREQLALPPLPTQATAPEKTTPS